VTTEVEALRDILDWGLYYVGNELECVCQSNERDLVGSPVHKCRQEVIEVLAQQIEARARADAG
jgi:hypothetical protein